MSFLGTLLRTAHADSRISKKTASICFQPESSCSHVACARSCKERTSAWSLPGITFFSPILDLLADASFQNIRETQHNLSVAEIAHNLAVLFPQDLRTTKPQPPNPRKLRKLRGEVRSAQDHSRRCETCVQQLKVHYQAREAAQTQTLSQRIKYLSDELDEHKAQLRIAKAQLHRWHEVPTPPIADIPAWGYGRRDLGEMMAQICLGSGTFGNVVQVRMEDDVGDDLALAVKLAAESEEEEWITQRGRHAFANEVEMLIHLGPHDRIIALRCLLWVPWLTAPVAFGMDLCRGGSLQDLSRAHAEAGVCFDDSLLMQILEQCLEGLVHMHQKDLQHADVKPANIMLERFLAVGAVASTATRVCFADFGMGTRLWGAPSVLTGYRGSPLHAAPELEHGQCTQTTDIWGLGASIVDVYHPGRLEQAFQARLTAPQPPSIPFKPDGALVDQLPVPLPAFVARCLQEDPGLRPTAAMLLDVVRACKADSALKQAWAQRCPLLDVVTPVMPAPVYGRPSPADVALTAPTAPADMEPLAAMRAPRGPLSQQSPTQPPPPAQLAPQRMAAPPRSGGGPGAEQPAPRGQPSQQSPTRPPPTQLASQRMAAPPRSGGGPGAEQPAPRGQPSQQSPTRPPPTQLAPQRMAAPPRSGGGLDQSSQHLGGQPPSRAPPAHHVVAQ
ncbi:hypothetical protein WJX73_008662 [Symbiochloris irregularis]|uniref:mitogen-activated protein kinase kinase kinase n=1 Tax=Symbiochloris irregularis TaxID=706552 RepID=A0AAW1PZG1_9CHLO